jgi:hypothetical protein
MVKVAKAQGMVLQCLCRYTILVRTQGEGDGRRRTYMPNDRFLYVEAYQTKATPAGAPLVTKPRYGYCRLCGRFGRLTKEHVPPASAFNDQEYLRIYADEIVSGLRWGLDSVGDRGIFHFTLCESCNNKTGSRYGAAYTEFVKSLVPLATPKSAGRILDVRLRKAFPLRIVKQVISMALSTSYPRSFNGDATVWNPFLDSEPPSPPSSAFSNPPDFGKLSDIYGQFRSFVRLRDAKGLPVSIRLYINLIANRGTGFRTGYLLPGSEARDVQDGPLSLAFGQSFGR